MLVNTTLAIMAHLQMLYSEWLDQYSDWLDQNLVRIQNKSPPIIFSLAPLSFGGNLSQLLFVNNPSILLRPYKYNRMSRWVGELKQFKGLIVVNEEPIKPMLWLTCYCQHLQHNNKIKVKISNSRCKNKFEYNTTKNSFITANQISENKLISFLVAKSTSKCQKSQTNVDNVSK